MWNHVVLRLLHAMQLTNPTHTGGSSELTYPQGWSVAEDPVFSRLKKKKKSSEKSGVKKKKKPSCSVTTLKSQINLADILFINQKWSIKFSRLRPLQNEFLMRCLPWWQVSPREEVLQCWEMGKTEAKDSVAPWTVSITGPKEAAWKTKREMISSNRTWSVNIHSAQETVTRLASWVIHCTPGPVFLIPYAVLCGLNHPKELIFISFSKEKNKALSLFLELMEFEVALASLSLSFYSWPTVGKNLVHPKRAPAF